MKRSCKKFSLIALITSVYFFSCQNVKAQFETKKYVAFANIYNSIRYFQPTESSKIIDWDNFAVYGLNSIRNCKNSIEFIDSIRNIFSSINSIFICSSKNESPKNFHFQNSQSLYYYEHNGLGTGCNLGYSSKIKEFLPQDSIVRDTMISLFLSECNVYFKFPILVVNQQISLQDSLNLLNVKNKINKIASSELKEFSESFRISNAVIIWGIFKNFYPYRNELNYDWDKELSSFIDKVIKTKGKDEYLIELKKFIAKYNDGHIVLNSYSDTLRGYYPPVELKLINNNIYISKTLNNNIKNIQGAKVLKINGMEADKYLSLFKEQVSASTIENRNYRTLKRILDGGRKTEFFLNIENQERKKIEIKLTRDIPAKEYEKKIIQYYPKYRAINDSVYYLNLSQVTMAEIDSLYVTLSNKKVIICDLRYYPTNNKNFLKYLLKCRDTISWIGIERIIYPNQKSGDYTYNGWYLEPSDKHISSRCIFLTTSNSISFSESYLSLIKYYNLGMIAGEKSGGTNGDYNCYNLFNQYYFYFTGARVLQLDGSPLYGSGIIPDINIFDDIDELKQDKDYYIDQLIKFMGNGK
ncbi:MAG: hypothetical protein J0L87_08065 [Bacteroidetes bacterium]|nr:hypothetical protein [Bacteroidota bacterium]